MENNNMLDRRSFMSLGGMAALALGGATVLGGCASGSSSSSASAASTSATASGSASAASTSASGASASAAAASTLPLITVDNMSDHYEGPWEDYFKNREFVHQVGFYAPDWKAFAQSYHDIFNAGPFYYTTNTFGRLLYRGEEVDCTGLEFHACYGSWGSHSVEVVQQVGDAPTMFTEFNDMSKPGMNHLHMFVEDLEEALQACDYLNIPVITVGYSDPEGARKKAEAVGKSKEEVDAIVERTKAHPSFMVIDLRDSCGCMVQLIEPSAKALHDLIVSARAAWDGETDLFRPIGG